MQTNKRQFCFNHFSGEDIYLFTLCNATTEVRITNYGAIITSFKIKQTNGSVNDIVLGFDKVEDYLSEEYLANYPYFGAVIGRYGNRIRNGHFNIDGTDYFPEKNKGNDHLHGGLSGFDKKAWICDHYSDRELVLRYHSEDGEEGYPGKLETVIRFHLREDNELVYEFTAITDKPTAVNLTHHSYFNLDNGNGTIANHLVKINSSFYLEQDANFVVTGKKLGVSGSHYDFRTEKKINKEWSTDGYDQSFVLDGFTSSDPAEPLLLAAEAFSDRSKLRLQVFTSEPLVHFYTGRWIAPMTGKNAGFYGSFSGFCFETQKHPNAINIPHFPNTVLRPGETYHTKTIYRVIS